MFTATTFRHLIPRLDRLALPTLAILTTLAAAGCGSDQPARRGARGDSPARVDSSGRVDRPDDQSALEAELEQRYIVGPAAARELNYRIDWQFNGAGENLRHLAVQGDSAFALNDDNYLTRIKVADGKQFWRVPGAAPIEDILSIDFLNNRVYLTSGAALLVLDGATGSLVGKQPFEKIANTAPVRFGQYFIYGSRNGQLVWHAYQIAYQFRAYQVARSIPLAPVVHEGHLVTVGNEGQIMVLNAANASQLWSRQLLDRIVAPPAVAHSTVYVAGLDQYLWAYDLGTGRKLWWVQTQSPLDSSPVVIGERLYQQIAAEGLACFNAVPLDSPGGERLWTAADVHGNVIMERRENLFVWDEKAHQLTLVEAGRGGVVKTLDLPQVQKLIVAGEKNEDLFASSADGRVIHLVPRN